MCISLFSFLFGASFLDIYFFPFDYKKKRRYPLTIQSGEGCVLTTTDGKQYLDCVSGIATCALGHNNAELTKAISQQMETVHHVSNLYFIPEQAALANWLCENSNAEKVFFCNSGAEANEAAIKLARRHASNRCIEVRFIFIFLGYILFSFFFALGGGKKRREVEFYSPFFPFLFQQRKNYVLFCCVRRTFLYFLFLFPLFFFQLFILGIILLMVSLIFYLFTLVCRSEPTKK